MVGKLLQQFLEQVIWGELDYLVVDMPPGTGDAQLSMAQLIPITGAVMVTTPQEVSIIDVEKAIAMWRKVEVPVLGVVENMSGYVCPSCGHHDEIFSRGGGKTLAARENVAFLGEVPIHPTVRGGGDAGKPIVLAQPDAPVSQTLRTIARSVACAISVRNGPELGKRSSKLTLIR
jgi:ATP-binding protein involved in chromosome partitioning